MSEIWKAVPGFEGSYEVSNMGRVRSVDRIVVCSGPVKGTYESLKKGRLLRPGRMPMGHQSVALGRGNSRCVHELVLLAFVGPCPPCHECRHLDGDEANNKLENLKWDTRGNNTRDKKWHKGTKRTKLYPPEIAKIKRQLSHYYRGLGAELAREYNVSHSLITDIKYGRVHIDVTGN